MLCIFCQTRPLDETTKPEHILLNGLGGRMTTKIADCSCCNGKFGSSIDAEVMRQVKLIRNMLHLESGTGKPAPVRKNIKAGEDTINIYGDGRMELVQKPFTFEKREDGSFSVEINANSIEHAERLVPDIAAALGISQSELRNQLGAATGRLIERRPGTTHSSEVFGGPEAIRSMVKSAMALWATNVGNVELHGSAYDSARKFVVEGDDDFNIAETHLDARLLPCAEGLSEEYGPLFNLIYVRSNDQGRVIGHFTLYN